MDSTRSDLKAFYDDEAVRGRREPASGRRIELLQDFVRLLVSERRTHVLDIGAGPGTDASAFIDAGLRYVGVDLSLGNAALAGLRGHQVIAASLFDLPFQADTFDAGWSLSTLMHVPQTEFADAMRAVLGSLAPGAPLAIGMWGGEERDFVTAPNEGGQRRLFSLRSAEQNRRLIAAHGDVERFESWCAGPADWEYHFAVLRRPNPPRYHRVSGTR